MSRESGRLAGIVLNTTPSLLACAKNHSLTVVARKPMRSHAGAGLLRGTTA